MVFGVLAAIAAVGAIVYFIITGFGAGDTLQVPQLVSMPETDARSAIADTKWFNVGKVTREYHETAPEGQVIDQTPKNGVAAVKGTTIDLVLSKGPAPAKEISVPDLTNKAPAEAQELLRSLGLVASAGEDVSSETVGEGRVATQSPAAGSTLKEGETVTYHLSMGAEKMLVPDLTGKTLAEAEALVGSDINIVTLYYYSDTVEYGVIMSQDPAADTKLEKGSTATITVRVSAGPENPTPTTGGSSSSSSSSGSGTSSGSGSESGSSSGSGSGSSGSGSSGDSGEEEEQTSSGSLMVQGSSR